MPTRITKQDSENSQKITSADSATLLNAIREKASTDYQEHVPYADNNPATLRQIGGYIMNSE